MLQKAIGKNTLGGGKKMQVNLKTYNRSTHDLSYAWRNTQAVGTLVPFMCEVGLPGDTFDIDLRSQILTHPTVGPLFGSFKFQADVFTCPIRLYNDLLHNNALNIGLDMSKVKLPRLTTYIHNTALQKTNTKTHPSSLYNYLGIKGFGTTKLTVDNSEAYLNATAVIAYYDIFKNYYANKQEDTFPIIGLSETYAVNTTKSSDNKFCLVTPSMELTTNSTVGWIVISNDLLHDLSASTINNIYVTGISFTNDYQKGPKTLAQLNFEEENDTSITAQLKNITGITDNGIFYKYSGSSRNYPSAYYPEIFLDNTIVTIRRENLDDIDKTRQQILSQKGVQYDIRQSNSSIPLYLRLPLSSPNTILGFTYPQCGLVCKTLQSDIFNNWINTDWIDGDNGINAITAIDTSSGEFTLDTLNLSKKVYNMLNRIAVSGGTYQDWVETVYTSNYVERSETPVYQGGYSSEIEFQEVISNSATDDEPLGSLAGRGVQTQHKGGRLHVKIDEPCYIIGICSITPRVDYCQGNRWDVYLDTLNDLHKPALDGIGFQDLTCDKMVANELLWLNNVPYHTSIGKQPAWIDYMTNYNRTFGNFAIKDNEAFMCLNRWYDYDVNEGTYDYSTYIDPTKYIDIFADTSLDAQNFWVQIGVGIQARRVMSAKVIPNL